MSRRVTVSGWSLAPESLGWIDAEHFRASRFNPGSCDTLIGYSLGAMLALEHALDKGVRRLILFAPTLCFSDCVSDEEINNLEGAVHKNTGAAVRAFQRQNNLGSDNSWSKEELLWGLEYLRTTSIRIQGKELDCTVFFSEKDNLIKPRYSIEVARELGCECICCDQTEGHGFFTRPTGEFVREIESRI